MSDIRYTEDHEWIRIEGDIGIMGVSDYAQEQLGDLVYVELPSVGKKVVKGMEVAIIESVKVASEVYAPIGGEVIDVNSVLNDSPEKVNEDAEGNGWLIRIKMDQPSEVNALMDGETYEAFLKGRT